MFVYTSESKEEIYAKENIVFLYVKFLLEMEFDQFVLNNQLFFLLIPEQTWPIYHFSCISGSAKGAFYWILKSIFNPKGKEPSFVNVWHHCQTPAVLKIDLKIQK